MIECGSQCLLCNLPIRFDTYRGCTHGCEYCFVKRKNDSLATVTKDGSPEQLKAFINGKRNAYTEWCDWDIPLHWGGMSDPFQPCELRYRVSYECLKIFAETKYPFVVSTKGRLAATDEYLELIKECNCVFQISAVSPLFNRIEKGCPTYEERIKMAEKIAPHVKRLIIRIQPYMPDVFKSVCENIPKLRDAGVYGVVLEGMKYTKRVNPSLEKLLGDYVYSLKVLEPQFKYIKELCHQNGLAFFSGENRLRLLGDSTTCCGCEGLEGFEVNKFNLVHIHNNIPVAPTRRMKEAGTAKCFCGVNQDTVSTHFFAEHSFSEVMNWFGKKDAFKKALTKR